MSIQLFDVTDSDIFHIASGTAAALVDLHIELTRLVQGRLGDQLNPRILVDLRETKVEASSREVPVFIEFLRGSMLPALRKRAGALVLLTDDESPTSPLGSVLAAIANLNEFGREVMVTSTFEGAYQELAGAGLAET